MRRRRHWGRVAVIVLVVLLAGAAVVGFTLARRGLPRTSGVLQSDVGSVVEIYRDDYGIPHIVAQNIEDLAYAQGYVQAQDRLWQMDMSRRGVGGKLSEILGDDFLGTDRFTLTVGFYRAAELTYNNLNNEAKIFTDRLSA